jgi:hypothetical protein
VGVVGLFIKNEKSGSLPDDNRGRFVKRVLPHCKVEEVGVMVFEIFHVFDPFADQLGIYTLDIDSGNVDRSPRAFISSVR